MDAEACELQFVKRNPTTEEFLALRNEAGWGSPPEPVVEAALRNTLFAVCAQTPDGKAVGMARIVGDGGIQSFVTDVIVSNEWRRRGLATRIMSLLVEYLEQNGLYGCGLFAAKGVEPLYEKFGFVVRPNALRGAGMTR